MRIFILLILGCCISKSFGIDEHRPKKKDDRGKRNLGYQISHHYSGPHSYRLERRISTGPQHPLYHNPQFFPSGPRPTYLTSYRKDGHNELSARTEDLLTDNNHVNEQYYGAPAPQPHIIERPVYIKEPEPIIEIIIKESNVTLPPPPTTPPPKKKKEQVQVFYVKYKKNPNGTGKDSVIYEKPIPAISPPIHNQDEEEEEIQPQYHVPEPTLPPPPSTTLRTIIKPDSETYHSPSGVKVTFGKEGFDYDKRSSKPEDYNRPLASSRQNVQFPQARQLSSFSNTYYKRAPITNNQNFPPPHPQQSFRQENNRPPQSYRPFNYPQSPQFKSNSQFPPPPPRSSPQSKYQFENPFKNNQFSSFSNPNQYQTISHAPPPVPPQFQSRFPPRPQSAPTPQFQQLPHHRQPVPYKPFESPKPQQSSFPANHQPHFSQPLRTTIEQHSGNSQLLFNQPQPVQFRPETHFQGQQHLPQPNQSPVNFNQPQFKQTINQQFNPQSNQQHYNQFRNQNFQQPQPQSNLVNHQPNLIPQQQSFIPQQHSSISQQSQNLINQFNNQQKLNDFNNQEISQNEHLTNLKHAQSVLPPGGELIHSLPRYEQHISIIEPDKKPDALALQKQEYLTGEQQPIQNIQNQQNTINQQSQLQQQAQINQQQLNEQTKQLQFLQQHLLQQQQQLYQNTIQSSTASPAFYQTTKAPPSTRLVYASTTTPKPTTPTTTTTEEPEKPSTTTKDPKVLEAQLPDEVPDDLRQQLLSSGILNNADISILDYDKVGDIPLSALPPDQLANFYSAGGAQQLAGSKPVPSITDSEGQEIVDQLPSGSEEIEVRAPPEIGGDKVEMKVVRYDPQTDRGQKVQESYVKDEAKRVDAVVLNDNTYNRYLPIKVNGTQFPIPDVPELKDKEISSVVVLAPVSFDFSSKRNSRDTSSAEIRLAEITQNLHNNYGDGNAEEDDIDLIQDDVLKQLLANPTLENYNKFFESEKKTRSDKQSVILLVARNPATKEKEIFMYDILTKSVSKLSGELSSAFVEAAEANAKPNSEENDTASASNIVETRIPYPGNLKDIEHFHSTDVDLEESPSDIVESKVPVIDPMEDLDSEASEQLESFVDVSGLSVNNNNVQPHEDLTVSASKSEKQRL